jgi:hypothetical protein
LIQHSAIREILQITLTQNGFIFAIAKTKPKTYQVMNKR